MSTQYGNQEAAQGGATGAAAAATSGQASSTGGASQSSGGQAASSDLNWGSARSDYGDNAYGGSLDDQGLGGKEYDDFSEGRRDSGSRAEATQSRSRAGSARGTGYSLGDTGSTGLTLLAGMVIGAALMYIFDPEQGARRRAYLRDKFVQLSSDTADTLGKTSRDLRNRAQGVIAETTKVIGRGFGQGESGASNTQEQSGANDLRESAANAGGAQ